MEMTDLFDPGSVVTNQRVNSKKQALQELAKRAAELTAQPEWAIKCCVDQLRVPGKSGRNCWPPRTSGLNPVCP